MRAATAYFVGAGTIIAAIAIGLGGGIVAGNIMNPIAPKQGPDTSKVERRAEAAVTPTTAPSEHVQYLTGSQAFGAMVAAPAQADAKSEVKPDEAQTTQASAAPPQPPSQPSVAVEAPSQAAPPQAAATPAVQQASTGPASAPDNAYAKARDSDVRRAASDRRRAERHERWAERRRDDNRDLRAPRDRTDWDDVARNVREDSSARDVSNRPRGGFPQIRVFGGEDD